MRTFLPAALVLLPRAASACAVCFGKSEGAKGLLDGLWWGIILLLSATFAMVGGIGWALYKTEKAREKAEAAG
jgi:hypothetical protein